jgi:hypothetical protein
MSNSKNGTFQIYFSGISEHILDHYLKFLFNIGKKKIS